MHYTLGQRFIIVMACRNPTKASNARKRLIKHLNADDRERAMSLAADAPLQILGIDLSSSLSVNEASRELRDR